MSKTEDTPEIAEDAIELDRRRAVLSMGKFAALTTPAVVTLLTADASEAWAKSLPGRRPPRPPRKR